MWRASFLVRNCLKRDDTLSPWRRLYWGKSEAFFYFELFLGHICAIFSRMRGKRESVVVGGSMSKFLTSDCSGKIARGVFLNTAKAQCSIHESGCMVFRCIDPGPESSPYSLDYFSLDEVDLDVLRQQGRILPLDSRRSALAHYDFWILNWHPSTMAPIVTAEHVRGFPGKRFSIVLEAEPDNPLRFVAPNVFDGNMVLDPTAVPSGDVFPFPRPLEGRILRPEPSGRPVPVIGSFGFGTPGKGFELVVDAVNREFDAAKIRINVPVGTYADETMFGIHQRDYPEHLASICRRIAKPGIDLEFTRDFLSPDELLDWCAGNDLNCFLYNRRLAGLSATTDQAVASGRALLVSSNDTFRHIHRYIPPYPVTSLRAAIAETVPVVWRIQEDWSRPAFTRTFLRMLADKGLLAETPDETGTSSRAEPMERSIVVAGHFRREDGNALDYAARIANCLGRSRKYRVTRENLISATKLLSTVSSVKAEAVVLVGTDSDSDVATSLRDHGVPVVAVIPGHHPGVEDRDRGSIHVDRAPVIPYHTAVVMLPPGPPAIWLVGFSAAGSNLESVVARILAEKKPVVLWIEGPAPTSDAWAAFEARLTKIRAGLVSTPSVTVSSRNLSLPSADEIIVEFAASRLVVFHGDPAREDELSDLCDFALATERSVVFTRAAPLPRFRGQGTYFEDFSIEDLMEKGASAQAGLYNTFSEGAFFAILDRAISAILAAGLGRPNEAAALSLQAQSTVDKNTMPPSLSHPKPSSAATGLVASSVKDLLTMEGDAFISCVYRRLLWRTPDLAGRDHYMAMLNRGVSRGYVAAEIRQSPEGRSKGVTLLGMEAEIIRYEWLRRPIIGPILRLIGLDKERLRSSPRRASGGEVSVTHLLAQHDVAFLRDAYQAILGRAPDGEGLVYYLGRLRQGDNPVSILARLRLSPEGRRVNAVVPGLDRAIRRYRWQRYPIIGTLARWRGGDNDRGLRKLRAIEAQLYQVLAAEQSWFDRLDQGVQGVKDDLTRLEAAVSARDVRPRVGRGSPRGGARTVMPSVVQQPRARMFYCLLPTSEQTGSPLLRQVGRLVGQGLLDARQPVRFVIWDDEEKAFRLVDRQVVSQWEESSARPLFSPQELSVYPNVGDPVRTLAPDSVQPGDWLLVCEIPCEEDLGPLGTMDFILAGKRLGLSVGFLFYGTQPLGGLTSGDADSYERYMQALLVSDAVVPVSSRAAESLTDFLIQRQLATCLPVISPLSLPGQILRQDRTPPVISTDDPTLLVVASMADSLFLQCVIRAFIRLSGSDDGRTWRLVLAGDLPPEQLNLIAGVAGGRIRFVSSPKDHEWHELYRNASLTVVSSAERCGGLLLARSLWYGKPCLCADASPGRGVIPLDGCDEDSLYAAFVRLLPNQLVLADACVDAAARTMNDWCGYARQLVAELDQASDPLARFDGMYYWVTDTAVNPHNSGVQRVVRQLARGLLNRGIRVIPVRWNAHERCLQSPTAEQLEHLSRWNGPRPEDWSRWIAPGENGAPQWLLVPEVAHGVLGIVREEAKHQGLRCAAIFYDTIPHKLRESFSTEFADNHRRYLDHVAAFDKVLSISHFSLEDFRLYCLGTRVRTPNADRRFRPLPLPTQHAEYPRAETVKTGVPDVVRILSVISIEPRKNPLVLLDAFEAALRRSPRPLELTLVGRRIPFFAELADQVTARVNASSRIRWEQDIDDQRLHQLYMEADFTVFPSLEEGYGLPIVESLWNGRPCISHQGGSMTEIAAGGGCVEVDMRDPGALTEAILDLATDDEYREVVAREAIVRPVHSWGDYAHRLTVELATDRLRDLVRPLPEFATVRPQMSETKPRPTLSLCISTYNRGSWLEVNLRNLFAQIPEPSERIEVLVVDNTSTDNTEDIIRPFQESRPDFRYVRNAKNVGMLGNLTVTAQMAQGEYIWIVGDDDLLKPGAIQTVLDVIEAHPGVSLIYPHYAYTFEKDPANVTDLAAFFAACPMTSPPTQDQFGLVREVATNNENLFTAIYCLVFRRDHGLRAYSQDTSDRPFSTMRSSIPTTYYVLNYMMEEPVYWIGQPMLVVNFNVSWNKYASLQILERVPEAQDLAESLGSNPVLMDRWRENLLPGFVHYWTELFENDSAGNAPFFSPERVVLRMKHLDRFAEITPALADVYERARKNRHPSAHLPTAQLFSAFNVGDEGHA